MHVCVHIYICECVGVCIHLDAGMLMFACVGWGTLAGGQTC